MSKRSLVLTLCLSLLTSLLTFASGSNRKKSDKGVSHVLLISVDGLHSLDAARYIASHPQSALAELASHGTMYTDANTPQLSDSFPGILALVTGGSPVTAPRS